MGFYINLHFLTLRKQGSLGTSYFHQSDAGVSSYTANVYVCKSVLTTNCDYLIAPGASVTCEVRSDRICRTTWALRYDTEYRYFTDDHLKSEIQKGI